MKFNNRDVIISERAQIGANVRIGDRTIIYDNVRIGDNSIISNDCILGEPLSDYYHREDYINPPTVIGEGSLIRSHAIIYADSEFGAGMSLGHRVTIREKVTAGSGLSIGTLSDIQGHCTFGEYNRLHSNVHIGQASTLGDFVFIYPYVVLTNDPHPPSNLLMGCSIGHFSQIAVHSVLLPGVKVGQGCLIGANSTVNKDVADGMLAVGSPAKEICPVNQIPSKEEGECRVDPV